MRKRMIRTPGINGIACTYICVLASILLSPITHAQISSQPVAVSARPLSTLLISQRRFAQAVVVPSNRAQVAAQVSAQIKSVNVDVGSQVKRGDLLAKLDATDYALALEQAQAMLTSIDAQIAQANDRLTRAQELSGSQYISADDLLGRLTDVSVLNANRVAQLVAIRVAKNNIAKTRITAPFDAAVVARSAQMGSYVSPAAPMFVLVQLSHREVEAQVASDMTQGLNGARQPFFERSGKRWPLKLLRITPVVESESGTQRVRFEFVDEVAPIGASGQLSWGVGNNLLPADMVLLRGNNLGVFIVDDGTARFHLLPLAQEGRPATIDLPASTQVVTNGRYKLQDGQKIQISASATDTE